MRFRTVLRLKIEQQALPIPCYALAAKIRRAVRRFASEPVFRWQEGRTHGEPQKMRKPGLHLRSQRQVKVLQRALRRQCRAHGSGMPLRAPRVRQQYWLKSADATAARSGGRSNWTPAQGASRPPAATRAEGEQDPADRSTAANRYTRSARKPVINLSVPGGYWTSTSLRSPRSFAVTAMLWMRRCLRMLTE